MPNPYFDYVDFVDHARKTQVTARRRKARLAVSAVSAVVVSAGVLFVAQDPGHPDAMQHDTTVAWADAPQAEGLRHW